MNELKREVKKHKGTVVSDGNGGYDVLAPDGFIWVVAEVWCQPVPLGDAETKEEKEEMIRTALSAVKEGVRSTKP